MNRSGQRDNGRNIPGKPTRNRSRAGRGLVHFSAKSRYCREKRKPKTWTCPLTGRPPPRKLGRSPVNGYQKSTQEVTSIAPPDRPILGMVRRFVVAVRQAG